MQQNHNTFDVIKPIFTIDNETRLIIAGNIKLGMAIHVFDKGEYDSAYVYSIDASNTESAANCFKIVIYLIKQIQQRSTVSNITKKASKTSEDIYFFWLLAAANKGHPGSQRQVGIHYILHDFRVIEKPDIKEGMRWLHLSADQGDASAMLELGNCYFYKKNVRDPTKAIEWFKKAALLYIPQAQWRLAYCYETGTGTEVNLVSASIWYIKAAENGDCLAQEKLISLYETGNTFFPRSQRDVDFWRALLKGNKPSTQIDIPTSSTTTERSFSNYGPPSDFSINASVSVYCKVANDFIEGSEGVRKNTRKGFAWLEKAAELGCNTTRLHLARSYLNGWNVEIDYEKALGFFIPLLGTDMKAMVQDDFQRAIMLEASRLAGQKLPEKTHASADLLTQHGDEAIELSNKVKTLYLQKPNLREDDAPISLKHSHQKPDALDPI